jgi:teichuronic acid biosynthesis glycosyltransferase TuaC
MRVLHVVSSLPTAERPYDKPFVLAQIESLIREGIYADTIVLNTPENKINYLTGIFRIINALRKKNYDLVHAHYSYCGWISLLQCSRPVLVSLMGDDLLGTPNGRGGLTALGFLNIATTRVLVKLVDGVIVKSSSMRKHVKVDNVYIVPNGIDFTKFEPSHKLFSENRHSTMKERTVLFVGNPNDVNKNIELAVCAIEIVKRRTYNLQFRNIFGVSQDEVAKSMRSADVLLFTSLQEGSPNVIKEAMACNLPIVSTDVGDVKDVIGETKGCFITSFAPDDVAEKLEMALRYGKRTNGRDHIRHLDMRITARRIIKVYDQVLREE